MKEVSKGKERSREGEMQRVGFRVLVGSITEEHHPFRKWMQFLIFLMLQKTNLIRFWVNTKYTNTVSINFRPNALQKRKYCDLSGRRTQRPVPTTRWLDTQKHSWSWGSQTSAHLDGENIKSLGFLYSGSLSRGTQLWLLFYYLAISPGLNYLKYGDAWDLAMGNLGWRW